MQTAGENIVSRDWNREKIIIIDFNKGEGNTPQEVPQAKTRSPSQDHIFANITN